jgi:hypothetical protein
MATLRELETGVKLAEELAEHVAPGASQAAEKMLAEVARSSRMMTITVEERSDGCMAYVDGDTGKWDCGQSPIDAIGRVMKNRWFCRDGEQSLSGIELFGVEVQERSVDYMAFLRDSEGIWSCGRSPEAAIGSFALTHGTLVRGLEVRPAAISSLDGLRIIFDKFKWAS